MNHPNQHSLWIVTLTLLLSFTASIGCQNDKKKAKSTSSKTTETSSIPQPTKTKRPIVLRGVVDGKEWSAEVTPFGALYYEGGIKMMDPTGNPLMQLAFIPPEGRTDRRQLTFQFKNFKGGIGKVDGKKFEALFSGTSPTDSTKSELQGYRFNAEDLSRNTNFTFEITKWERVSPDKAIMSAKFSGVLRGALGAPNVEFGETIVEGLEIVCYTAPY